MEDRFSQDNMSHNNLRDSHSNGNGIHIRSKNVTGGGSVNSLTNSKNNNENGIIPERRRKYLAGASDENTNPSVGQKIMGVDNMELIDD